MSTRITLGNMSVDRSRYMVWVDGREVELTFVEFELLHALASNAGKVLGRDHLTSAIWQERSDETHKLTVHISRLRRKLDGIAPWRIETVNKRGYVLRNASEGASSVSIRNLGRRVRSKPRTA